MRTGTISMLVCVLCSVLLSSSAVDIPQSLRQAGATDVVETAYARVRDNGCDPNICFAIDGSGSITNYQFTLQKDFVKLIASILSADPEGTYSAVQYGLGLERITRRATSNIENFLYAVEGSEQLNSGSTFIAPGVGHCIRQLGRNRFRGEPKTIVLLGDGRANFDSRGPPLDPATIVSRWLRKDSAHSVSGVAVNFSSVIDWATIVGGRRNVFRVGQWDKLLDVLEDLVIDICGWKNLDF